MAGGTGGHIYPALACADEIHARSMAVVWLGSKGGMEERLVARSHIALHLLSIKGVRGKGLMGLLAAPFRVVHAIGQALAILRYERPDVVLGMGGFVAGPGGVAAKLLGIPLVIHEQNAIAGTTNRLLARVASLQLQAFDKALPSGITLGNPVRQAIFDTPKRLSAMDAARPLRLLVVGGSLGAQAINEVIPEVLAHWAGASRLDVWHQTGSKHVEVVQARYAALAVEGKVEAYIEHMEQAYYWADIVICRSGAMTVSELAVAGLPSILVPYPHAIDDHQTHNALSLERSSAAILLPQSQLTKHTLIDILSELAVNRERLTLMGNNARIMSSPQATQDVVQYCLGQIKHD